MVCAKLKPLLVLAREYRCCKEVGPARVKLCSMAAVNVSAVRITEYDYLVGSPAFKKYCLIGVQLVRRKTSEHSVNFIVHGSLIVQHFCFML